MIILSTRLGDIVIELYADKAPVTVKNFISYVEDGFYEGTIFHRVIPGFVIQGGGLTEDMKSKPTRNPIENESKNGLSNKRGTLAMARTQNPNSATSQFFINLTDNLFLDASPRGAGYTVFGEVVEGMEAVDKIAALPTGRRGMYDDVPLQPVVIESARVVEEEEEE